MALAFSELTSLFTHLEDLELNDVANLDPRTKPAKAKGVVELWFQRHRLAINIFDTASAVALISALLPERRTDRVYGVQAPGLCNILSRALGLRSGRVKDLKAYEQPGCGDLATCVERVLKSCGPPARPSPSVKEVDDVLMALARSCRFSASSVRGSLPKSKSTDSRNQVLGHLFKRLTPSEGKWLVRLILKDLSPLRINEFHVLRTFHFLLPDLLQFQDDFGAAIGLLKSSLNKYPSSCDIHEENLHRATVRESIRPVVGIKVGRPSWSKAWSIDQCLKLTAGQRWVLERKYDGEYCEIHIDLNRSEDVSKCITIFSKSGKDSTADRVGLHDTIIECLRLRQADRKISRAAILLGEMVIYSDSQQCVLPFEKIRQHVTRSGSYIGIDNDHPPERDEHLAIVFFDILLMDDELVLNKPIDERRMWLREAYTKIPGRAFTAEWKTIDFSREKKDNTDKLITQFAASIAGRCEGLILKPCVPYFALEYGSHGRVQSFIKLKKDYMDGMGDEADMAVIGASYNAQQAAKCAVPNVPWTDFHLGCLVNKESLRFGVRPRFRIVRTIQQEHCIPTPILKEATALGKFVTDGNPIFDIDSTFPHPRMDVLFSEPFVFEVLGSGFENPSNTNFQMLRHPRVKKLHHDRSWRDCKSFQELQDQAREARERPADSESQETRRWIEKLEGKCKKKFERERTKTPSTVRTSTTRRSESQVDGGTLFHSSLKRKRDTPTRETPCPPAKRSRLSDANPSVVVSRSSPLSDITNTAPRPSRARPSPPRPTPFVATATCASQQPKTKERDTIGRLTTFFVPTPPSSAENPKHSSNSSSTATLSLAETDVYLAPSLAAQNHILHTELRKHKGLVLVPDLASLEQQSSTPPRPSSRPPSREDEILPSPLLWQHQSPPSSVVADSQPSPPRRRVVLIDPEQVSEAAEIKARLRRVRETVCRHCGRSGDDGVKIWDWRFFVDVGGDVEEGGRAGGVEMEMDGEVEG